MKNPEEAQKNKYLRQMKELPPVYEEGKVEKDKNEEKESKVSLESEKISDSKRKIKLQEKPDKKKKEEKEDLKSVLDEDGEELEADKKRLPLSSKDIILGVINLISVIFLIVILSKLPLKAEELKSLRTQETVNQANETIQFPEISEAMQKAQELEPLFLDEGGIVNFVDDLEKIKSETNVIKKVTFTNQKVVKDKTGNSGYPVLIEMTGSWGDIDGDLQKIDKLPYLFKAVKVDAQKSDEEGVVIFNYGIFLYVNPELAKN